LGLYNSKNGENTVTKLGLQNRAIAYNAHAHIVTHT